MRKRPLALLLCSLLFLYFPLELLWKSQHTLELKPLDIFLSGVLPFVLLLGLIRVTKVGWYTLVAMISLWGMHDLQTYYSAQQSAAPFLVHVGIYIFSLSYFINPRVRHLYFDPKLRWWRTKPRYETHLPFLMNHNSQWHYPILRNISEGGCFVETPHLLALSDLVQIAIPLPVPLGISVIKAEGEVRWVSNNPLRHGMGVEFKTVTGETLYALKEFVQRQL